MLPVLQTSAGQYDEAAKTSHRLSLYVKKSERVGLSLVICITVSDKAN
jgi:hypothetical protein